MLKDIRIQCFLVFAFSVLFVFAVYFGLPFDFTKDYTEILGYVEKVDYGSLMKWIVNPLTPAWFFMEDITSLRPFPCLVIKFSMANFGSSAFLFQVIDFISAGIFCVILFMLIFQINGSRILAWLGVLFYLTLPPNFYAVVTYSRNEYISSLIRIVPVILTGVLSSVQIRSRLKFAISVFFWYAFTVLAIKTKSSEKILPFVYIAFLLWRMRPSKSLVGGRVWTFLMGVSILMLTSVVPIPGAGFPSTTASASAAESGVRATGSERKEKEIHSFSLQNIYESLVQHPKGENPFLTVIKRKEPMTVTESFGFPVAWLFWGLLFLSFVALLRLPSLKAATNHTEYLRHFFWLFLGWSVAVALGMGTKFAVGNPRYLNYFFVPALPLFFLSLELCRQAFAPLRRFAFAAVIIAGLSFSTIYNSGIFLALLIHFGGGMTYSVVEADKAVFKDMHGREPAGHELYYAHNQFRDQNLLIDWHNDVEQQYPTILEKSRKDGRFYFMTQNPKSERLALLQSHGHKPELIRTINFLDAQPAVFRVMKAFKSLAGSNKKRQTYVYRINL